MALTRDFIETIKELVEKDTEFRVGLLKEAVDNLLAGDVGTGRLLLRDYINATVGFEVVAEQVKMPPKSLHRMLGVNGNPRADNLFRILALLQNAENVDMEVQIKPAGNARRMLGIQELRATYDAGVEPTGNRAEALGAAESRPRYVVRPARRKRS
jgi:hypothetical protein